MATLVSRGRSDSGAKTKERASARLLGRGEVLLGVLLAGLPWSAPSTSTCRLTLAGLFSLPPMNFHLLDSYSFMAARSAAASSASNSA
jgi:hypothetical protein